MVDSSINSRSKQRHDNGTGKGSLVDIMRVGMTQDDVSVEQTTLPAARFHHTRIFTCISQGDGVDLPFFHEVQTLENDLVEFSRPFTLQLTGFLEQSLMRSVLEL
jgi:hypothetical protein